MTSRERIARSINHKEPDRIPIDLGGTEVSSIGWRAYHDLMSYLNFDEKNVSNNLEEVYEQLPVIDRRLMEWIGVDVIPIMSNPPSTWKKVIKDNGNYWNYVDQWGTTLSMPKDGYYFDFRRFPITELSIQSINQYRWPDPDDPSRTRGLKQKAKALFESTPYSLIGTALFGGGIFEQPARIMGIEEYLMGCANNISCVDAVMERITEIYLKATENFLNEVGDFMQVYCYWDDIATQDGPLISPWFYRKYVKPKQKRLFDLIHKKSQAKVLLHCCGACYEFIPDFIEIGMDIINPIQVSARGMEDTARLKRDFGKDIVFWGGGINSQQILTFGSPRQIREEVKRRIDDLAPGGGFIFNSGHNIQNFVPPENIVTMYETLRKNWAYS